MRRKDITKKASSARSSTSSPDRSRMASRTRAPLARELDESAKKRRNEAVCTLIYLLYELMRTLINNRFVLTQTVAHLTFNQALTTDAY